MRAATEKQSRRWSDQRWVVDRIIQAVGPEWDHARLRNLPRICGGNVGPDVAQLQARIQKFNDIPREFGRVARAREQAAIEEEEQGHRNTARDNYHAAAVFYCNAAWGIFEADSPQREQFEQKVIETYDGYIRNASYKIERVEIPFQGKSLPALFHIPPGVEPPYPVVLRIMGLDHVKEESPIDDPFLDEGFAVLAPDGPGKGESLRRKIYTTADNFAEAGKNCLDYLESRPDVDASRLALTGVSMGTFWGIQMASGDERFKAASFMAPCYEPGMYTIFNSASPTFRMCYMNITNIRDDDEFDEFCQELSVLEEAPGMKCPTLVVTGEDEELSPLEYIEHVVSLVEAPKRLDIYEGSRHGIADPYAQSRAMDWLIDRVKGKPMKSQRFFWPLGGGPAIVTDL